MSHRIQQIYDKSTKTHGPGIFMRRCGDSGHAVEGGRKRNSFRTDMFVTGPDGACHEHVERNEAYFFISSFAMPSLAMPSLPMASLLMESFFFILSFFMPSFFMLSLDMESFAMSSLAIVSAA